MCSTADLQWILLLIQHSLHCCFSAEPNHSFLSCNNSNIHEESWEFHWKNSAGLLLKYPRGNTTTWPLTLCLFWNKWHRAHLHLSNDRQHRGLELSGLSASGATGGLPDTNDSCLSVCFCVSCQCIFTCLFCFIHCLLRASLSVLSRLSADNNRHLSAPLDLQADLSASWAWISNWDVQRRLMSSWAGEIRKLRSCPLPLLRPSSADKAGCSEERVCLVLQLLWQSRPGRGHKQARRSRVCLTAALHHLHVSTSASAPGLRY